ncbi:thioesterase family protein [Kitasatospora sp. NPDC101176]|uniref:thioesterase family protein n=1 Tax=Kitasatospora sp. NPDC101176 TaxID=3364099 RepID=UPI0038105C27
MTTGTTAPDSYYQRIDEDHYKPTAHAGGAWDTAEQHFSPLAGLVVHAVDRHLAARPDTGLTLSRISYDILGRLPLDECTISVESIRPGRTVELLEAVVVIGDRPVVRARAWLLAASDTAAVAATAQERMAPPEECEPWAMDGEWDGGYVSSIEVRRGPEHRPGRATAWISSPVTLVAGEPSSALASYLALVDTANGIAPRQPHTDWMFPNVDLTVHLHRHPEGRWTGLDTTVSFGPTGLGLTSSVLHDRHGPMGCAQQSLTVRPQPGAAG